MSFRDVKSLLAGFGAQLEKAAQVLLREDEGMTMDGKYLIKKILEIHSYQHQ